MKKIISSMVKMFIRFGDFISLYNNALANQVQIMEVVDLIKEEIKWLNENVQVKQSPTEGYTQAKQERKKKLVTNLFSIMSFLRNDAIKQNDQVLTSRMTTTRRKLVYLNGPSLLAKSRETITVCEDKIEELASIGIAGENLERLKKETEEFRQSMTKPREVRDQKKTANQNIEEASKRIQDLINDRLTPLLQSRFEETHPQLIQDYLNAIRIHKPKTRKLALIGKVWDKTTNEPLNHVWIEIPGTPISYRTNSKQGGFQVANLEEGQYQLHCKCESYTPVQINFFQVFGQTTRLEISMNHVSVKAREEVKKQLPVKIDSKEQ